MGTDIHTVAQAMIDGDWVDVDFDYSGDRHYNLFAHLAGVRNGTGFAGVKIGSRVEPIQECRGLPNDFQIEDDMHGEVWMGDHSRGFVYVDEILSHDFSVGFSCGIISIDEYNKWDGGEPTYGWCGDVCGNHVSVAESADDINEKTTHVRVSWPRSIREFQYFIDAVMALKGKYGNARIVFGFDS